MAPPPYAWSPGWFGPHPHPMSWGETPPGFSPFGGGPCPWPQAPSSAAPFTRRQALPRGLPCNVPAWFNAAPLAAGVHRMLDLAYSQGLLQVCARRMHGDAAACMGCVEHRTPLHF
jgi:hypothetical protein